jgi:hypothetical protein
MRVLWIWLVLVFLAAWLFFCPATWLDYLLAHSSAGQWRLVAASGSLWHGSGRLVCVAVTETVHRSSTLSWRFEPAGLPGLRLSWRLAVASHFSVLSWGRGGWRETAPQSLPAGLFPGLPRGECTPDTEG